MSDQELIAKLLEALKAARHYVALGVANSTKTTAEGRRAAGQVFNQVAFTIALAEEFTKS